MDFDVPDVVVAALSTNTIIAQIPIPENCALEAHGLQYLAGDTANNVGACVPIAKVLRRNALMPVANDLVALHFAADILSGNLPHTAIVAGGPTGWYLNILQDGQANVMQIASRWFVSLLPLG